VTEAPISFERIGRAVKRRPALTGQLIDAVRDTVFVSGQEPRPSVVAVDQVTPAVAVGDEATYRVDIEVSGRAVGVHSFGPGLSGTKLAARRKLLHEQDHPDQLSGFLPDHLALRPLPNRLGRQFRPRVKRRVPDRDDPNAQWATTIFGTDDRYAFNDTSFPWCTAGRVETSNGGWASGTMIGPRHLLTCSHTIGWIANPDPYVAGWVKFMPSYFDGSTPFGTAWGTHIYWQQQVFGPTVDGTEERHDYVVVVLDSRIGDLTGWMGSRSYTDDWDGGTYWSHVGYPQDISSGTRPIFIGNFSLDGRDTEPDTDEAMLHQADVIPGQSGGPMFGWWDGEPWPRVVADQSWQNPQNNGASGGSQLVDLVIRARNDFP
jgi:V8-like Glu-specific endopeptidase